MKRSGKRWIASLIKHLWSNIRDQREDRNESLHANTIAQERRGLHNLKREVEDEYDRGTSALPLKRNIVILI